jgi:hypothetical protein
MKFLMNSFYGKAIQKPCPTYSVDITADKLEQFKYNNQNFLYSITKRNNTYDCKLIKPLLVNYSLPQFACNVLSYSLMSMADLIYTATDIDCEIFYINTDCLTLRKDDFDRLNEKYNLLGNEMGKFSIEVESNTFYAIAPYKTLHIRKDGTLRTRCFTKLPDPLNYFEKQINP